MKRTIDKPYGTYSVYTAASSGIFAKCPQCHGRGIVTSNITTACFKCTNCNHSITKDRTLYRYDVHNQCQQCGQYYRVDITEQRKQHFPMVYAACPHCGFLMPGYIHKTAKALYSIGEIKNGCEPFFGYELWFLSTFRGKPIWALNREHLAYLIDYLSADLRENPVNFYQMKTQADHLPAFMKSAKNRKGIVKQLRRMLDFA